MKARNISEGVTAIDSRAARRFMNGNLVVLKQEIFVAKNGMGDWAPAEPELVTFNYEKYPENWERDLKEGVHKFLQGLRPNQVGSYPVFEVDWARKYSQPLDSGKVGDFMLQVATKLKLGLLGPNRLPGPTPGADGASWLEYYLVIPDITRFVKRQG